MKLLAPIYYKEFKCIADKCHHSCCIGWEIDIDADAIESYSSLSGEYSEKIRESIDFNDTPHFKLLENDKCPHLDGDGLCRIISEYGEGYLCEICREHPRFYNDTIYGKEVGIGMSCEEAARIVLEACPEELCSFSSSEDGELTPPEDALPVTEAISEREALFGILFNPALSARRMLAELLGASAKEAGLSYTRLGELFASLEAMEESFPRDVLYSAQAADADPVGFANYFEEFLFSGGRNLIFAQLHRYYLDSVYFLDREERIKLAVAFALGVALLCYGRGYSKISATVSFSKATDYSTENTDTLLFALGGEDFSKDRLLALIF